MKRGCLIRNEMILPPSRVQVHHSPASFRFRLNQDVCVGQRPCKKLGRNPEPDPRTSNSGSKTAGARTRPGDSTAAVPQAQTRDGVHSVFHKSEGLKSENQSSVTLPTDQELIAITTSALLTSAQNTIGCFSAAAKKTLCNQPGVRGRLPRPRALRALKCNHIRLMAPPGRRR